MGESNQQINFDLEKVGLEEIEKVLQELDATEVEDADKYVLRELITSRGDDIFFKTDLTPTQIKSLVQIRTADMIMRAQSKSVTDFDQGMEESTDIVVDMTELLMKLLVSKMRLGRQELIEAYQGKREGEKTGMFKNFFGSSG